MVQCHRELQQWQNGPFVPYSHQTPLGSIYYWVKCQLPKWGRKETHVGRVAQKGSGFGGGLSCCLHYPHRSVLPQTLLHTVPPTSLPFSLPWEASSPFGGDTRCSSGVHRDFPVLASAQCLLVLASLLVLCVCHWQKNTFCHFYDTSAGKCTAGTGHHRIGT